MEVGPTQEEDFNTLKQALVNPPVLQLPSFQHDFVVETDASKVALGASLMQDVGQGLQPVQYCFRKLTAAEARYATHDRELLAIVAAFKRFRPYVSAGYTLVATDHAPLKCVPSQPNLSDR